MFLASTGWDALTALLPFVLLFAFWFFLMRRVRSGQVQSPAQQATLDKLDESFGITTTLVLPGGVEVMLYEPRHASPLAEFR